MKLSIIFTILISLLASCNNFDKEQDVVRIRIDGFPPSLNVLMKNEMAGAEILNKTFNYLLSIDNDLKIKPVILKSQPTISESSVFTVFDAEIREEASWNDNSPYYITRRCFFFGFI